MNLLKKHTTLSSKYTKTNYVLNANSYSFNFMNLIINHIDK